MKHKREGVAQDRPIMWRNELIATRGHHVILGLLELSSHTCHPVYILRGRVCNDVAVMIGFCIK
jgi:hypothetical protein